MEAKKISLPLPHNVSVSPRNQKGGSPPKREGIIPEGPERKEDTVKLVASTARRQSATAKRT
jgi:hypothetical protein